MKTRSPRRHRKKATNISLAPAQPAAKLRRCESWRAENRAAIDAYNRHVEREGIFGEEYRRF